MKSTVDAERCLNGDRHYGFGDTPITSFDDERLNPFRGHYNPVDAWNFFVPMAIGSSCPFFEPMSARKPWTQFIQWRSRYCDPNNPRCDRCAVLLNQGRFPERVREPPYAVGAGHETCSTGGDTTCGPCEAAGVTCTTFGLRAEFWVVREYVRGRGFHWYEGMAQRPCDGCLSKECPDGCLFWREGGCERCQHEGRRCLVNGHEPGSFAERMSRRQGYEHRILELGPDRHQDGRRDEAYLIDVAMNNLYGPGEPSTVLPQAPPAFPNINPNSGYAATVEQAEAALVQMGMRVAYNPSMSSLVPALSATCYHCFRNKSPCSSDGPGSTCTRCAMNGYECIWPTAAKHSVSLKDSGRGRVLLCLECENEADSKHCDAELGQDLYVEEKGCTTCKRRGRPCVVRYKDSNNGQESVVALAPRPDGLTPPLCCDHCVEDPEVGINGCSFRHDYLGAQEPDSPCRRCSAKGLLCTIGGYYFFSPAAQPGPHFSSHLGAARPTHLFLTKRLDHTINGDVTKPFSQRELQGNPREDCAFRPLRDGAPTRDVLWGVAAGGTLPENRNVGLYMPDGPLAPLPELVSYEGEWDPSVRARNGRVLRVNETEDRGDRGV